MLHDLVDLGQRLLGVVELGLLAQRAGLVLVPHDLVGVQVGCLLDLVQHLLGLLLELLAHRIQVAELVVDLHDLVLELEIKLVDPVARESAHLRLDLLGACELVAQAHLVVRLDAAKGLAEAADLLPEAVEVASALLHERVDLRFGGVERVVGAREVEAQLGREPGLLPAHRFDVAAQRVKATLIEDVGHA